MVLYQEEVVPTTVRIRRNNPAAPLTRVAQEILELTQDEAWHLFYGPQTYGDPRRTTKPADAARAIERLLNGTKPHKLWVSAATHAAEQADREPRPRPER